MYIFVWGCMYGCRDVWMCVRMYVSGGVGVCVGVYVEYVHVSVYIDTRG
jgi:hypothetical protein